MSTAAVRDLQNDLRELVSTSDKRSPRSKIFRHSPEHAIFTGRNGAGKSLWASILCENFLMFSRRHDIPFEVFHLGHLPESIFGPAVTPETWRRYILDPPCENILYDDESLAGGTSTRTNQSYGEISDMRQARKSKSNRYIISASTHLLLKDLPRLAAIHYELGSRDPREWWQNTKTNQGNLCPAYYKHRDPKLRWNEQEFFAKHPHATRKQLFRYIDHHRGMDGTLRSCLSEPERFDLNMKIYYLLGKNPWKGHFFGVKCAHRWYDRNRTEHIRKIDNVSQKEKNAEARSKKAKELAAIKTVVLDVATRGNAPIYRGDGRENDMVYMLREQDGGKPIKLNGLTVCGIIKEERGVEVDSKIVSGILRELFETVN